MTKKYELFRNTLLLGDITSFICRGTSLLLLFLEELLFIIKIGKDEGFIPWSVSACFSLT